MKSAMTWNHQRREVHKRLQNVTGQCNVNMDGVKIYSEDAHFQWHSSLNNLPNMVTVASDTGQDAQQERKI
jgi:hypothetical protein